MPRTNMVVLVVMMIAMAYLAGKQMEQESLKEQRSVSPCTSAPR